MMGLIRFESSLRQVTHVQVHIQVDLYVSGWPNKPILPSKSFCSDQPQLPTLTSPMVGPKIQLLRALMVTHKLCPW